MSVQVDPSSIFVLVPVYNESEMIRKVVQELAASGYSVIVIDDGSDNDLQHVLTGLNLSLLRHRINLGQGAALQTGIEFALSKKAQYLITFDGDGQHELSDIPKLIEPLMDSKADIVLGSRFLADSNHIPQGRRLVLKLARYINYLFTGLLLTDAHNGLRAMTAQTAARIKMKENRMSHATELISIIRKEKMSYLEVAVHIRYTDYSRNKGQTNLGGFRILFDLLLNKIFK